MAKITKLSKAKRKTNAAGEVVGWEPAWQVRWRDPSGKQRARRFDRKVDAERFLTTTSASMLDGSYIDPSAGKLTVAAYWAEWSELQPSWTLSTRARYDIMWAKHIEPKVGGMRLASVRNSHLQNVISSSGLAPSTTKVLRSVLVSMFRGAEVDERIRRSPAVGLKVAEGERSEPRPLDPDEVRRLLDACDGWERAWVTLGLATGVRISEGLAVRLGTVNFLQREIVIGDQALTPQSGPTVLAPLKTRKTTPTRTIPMTEQLHDVLAAHRDSVGVGDDGVLFPAPDGSLERRQLASHRFAAIAARADLEGLTWHNLRDTAATNMLRDGVSPKIVSEVLGNTVAVLLDRYAGTVPEDRERVRESLARITAATA